MKARTITIYGLLATIVIIIGALSGWYFFLRGQTAATGAADAARGFEGSTPFGPSTGSTYQNQLSSDSSGFSSGSSNTPTSKPVATLWHTDTTPVAGFAFSGNASSTKVVFVERGNGYIFSADLGNQDVRRITNTLMSKTYEAYFTASGDVIVRGIGSDGAITTFLGHVATTSTGLSSSQPVALNGDYLNKNIRTITSDPSTGNLFFIVGSIPDISGISASNAGDKQKTVLTTALPDWGARWLSDGRIILWTKPADGVPGFAYVLTSGTLAPLIDNVSGLTLLPRAGTPAALLYGSSSGGGLLLFAQIGKANAALLPIKTIADKCVWAPAGAATTTSSLVAYCAVPQAAPIGNFLNDWYKGIAHTSDAWWKVNASAGTAELVYTPNPSLSLDVVDPAISPSGQYLAFRNGNDDSLWVLNLVNNK
jgi:hypothetical protein